MATAETLILWWPELKHRWLTQTQKQAYRIHKCKKNKYLGKSILSNVTGNDFFFKTTHGMRMSPQI